MDNKLSTTLKMGRKNQIHWFSGHEFDMTNLIWMISSSMHHQSCFLFVSGFVCILSCPWFLFCFDFVRHALGFKCYLNVDLLYNIKLNVLLEHWIPFKNLTSVNHERFKMIYSSWKKWWFMFGYKIIYMYGLHFIVSGNYVISRNFNWLVMKSSVKQ